MTKHLCHRALVSFGLLLGLSVCAAPSASAAPITLDFDSGQTSGSSISANYGGLTWSNVLAISNADYAASPYLNTYGAPSGDFAATNGFFVGSGISIGGGASFSFDSARFSTFAESDLPTSFSAASLFVYGYRLGDDHTVDAIPFYAASFDLQFADPNSPNNLLPSAYALQTFNWTGLDALAFYSSSDLAANPPLTADGLNWLMDDMTITIDPGTNSVPEPGTLLLLGTGLAAVARLRRRRV